MKLSEFIFKIIEKIREVPRKTYLPYAWVWHIGTEERAAHPRSNGKNNTCMACLAGLYAAASKWVPPNKSLLSLPEFSISLTDELEKQLCAIDDIRNGYWQNAQKQLGIKETISPTLGNYPKPPHEKDFKSWPQLLAHLESLRERAKQLQALGF